MTPLITTSYVSRICAAPPHVAQAALMSDVGTLPHITGRKWQLVMDSVVDGRLEATLSSSWSQRTAVIIEVEPWSRSRAFVGLRHRSRGVPWWSASYFAAAHEAVAMITDRVERWADEPLRRLVDDSWLSGLPLG
jgi:hypothetical protein